MQLTQLKYCKILTFFLRALAGAGGCNLYWIFCQWWRFFSSLFHKTLGWNWNLVFEQKLRTIWTKIENSIHKNKIFTLNLVAFTKTMCKKNYLKNISFENTTDFLKSDRKVQFRVFKKHKYALSSGIWVKILKSHRFFENIFKCLQK